MYKEMSNYLYIFCGLLSIVITISISIWTIRSIYYKQKSPNTITIKSILGINQFGSTIFKSPECSYNYEIIKAILEYINIRNIFPKNVQLTTGDSEDKENQYVRRKTRNLMYMPMSIINIDGLSIQYECNQSADYKTITLTIASITLSIMNINKFIQQCYTSYIDKYYSKELLMSEKHKIYYYLMIPKDFSKDGEKNYTLFHRFEMKHKKTFNDIFFPEKELLISNLDDFNTSHTTFSRYSILLYGKPGCGKTSIVKAICTQFRLHVINVKLSEIESIYQLMDIFHNDQLKRDSIHNDEYDTIEHKRRLYLFEDIDLETALVLKDQSKDNRQYKMDMNVPNIQPIMQSQTTTLASRKNLKSSIESNSGSAITTQTFFQKKKLTLSEILNMLDGVLELNDCIIVITTNNIDRLDPALIRPGRINMKIELRAISFPDFLQIMEHNLKLSSLTVTSDQKGRIQNIVAKGVITGSILESYCQSLRKACIENESIDVLLSGLERLTT